MENANGTFEVGCPLGWYYVDFGDDLFGVYEPDPETSIILQLGPILVQTGLAEEVLSEPVPATVDPNDVMDWYTQSVGSDPELAFREHTRRTGVWQGQVAGWFRGTLTIESVVVSQYTAVILGGGGWFVYQIQAFPEDSAEFEQVVEGFRPLAAEPRPYPPRRVLEDRFHAACPES